MWHHNRIFRMSQKSKPLFFTRNVSTTKILTSTMVGVHNWNQCGGELDITRSWWAFWFGLTKNMVKISLIHENCCNVKICSDPRQFPYIWWYSQFANRSDFFLLILDWKHGLRFSPYGPPYITYSPSMLLGANLFCSCQYRKRVSEKTGNKFEHI